MPRLDAYLVATGQARSRERARSAIAAGLVRVNGAPASKASRSVSAGDEVVCTGEDHPYVSRGALKLEAALERFAVAPDGRVCLDLGASTGGFTEVLRTRGASKVYAVDVGHGQLDPKVAADPGVVNLERTHAKDLTPSLVREPIGLLVCDVSFISVTKALPSAFALCAADAEAVILVKPQFELGPAHLGKNGLVRDTEAELEAWLAADIVPWFTENGWPVRATMRSPIKGGDGNTEFLLAASLG